MKNNNSNPIPETAVDPKTLVLGIYTKDFEAFKTGKLKEIPVMAIPLEEMGKISHYVTM